MLTELGYLVGGAEVSQRLAYWLPDPASRVLVCSANEALDVADDRPARVVGFEALGPVDRASDEPQLPVQCRG